MRYNIYSNGKLIGQNYQRENGDWMHKWYDSKDKKFERGSWKGKCGSKDDNMSEWKYKLVRE